MRRAVLSMAFLLLAGPALALSQTPYLANVTIDMTQILPPPPAPGSSAQAADMAAVLAAQKTRTEAQEAKAEADAPIAIIQFADVLGPGLTKDAFPKLNDFLTKVSRESNVYGNSVKDLWKRPRPFIANPLVQPSLTMKDSTKDLQGQPTFSYPSGNAAFGAMMAIILSDMVPEKRAEIFARGWELGQSRIVGGVHYPTDVEAGRLYASIIVALMMQNPVFRADMAEAKSELRNGLKLSR